MMQYSTFFDRKKTVAANSKSLPEGSGKVLFVVFKVVALLLMLYFIGEKIRQGQLSFGQLWQLVRKVLGEHNHGLLLLPLLLVAANWGLEARKWQLLAAPVIKLDIWQAIRAVLTGLSLGFVTPRSVGDYAGRIIEAPGKGRGRLLGAVLLNRVSQSFITCFFGLPGFVMVLASSAEQKPVYWPWLVVVVFVALGAMLLLLLGQGRFWLIAFAERHLLKSLVKTIKILRLYTQKDILLVIFFAFLRYAVFTFQFVLILYFAGVQLPALLLAGGVAAVFLLKSVIPAFNFLSDLGVREFSALWVFSYFAVPENQLLTASLLVWSLNILLPTLLGGVNIFRLRLNRL